MCTYLVVFRDKKLYGRTAFDPVVLNRDKAGKGGKDAESTKAKNWI